MRNNSRFSAMRRAALAMLLILAGPLCALAQVRITGKITDELKAPMAGVSIIEKGTQNGAISDVDGNYSITADEGAVLE
ncbi:MAG: carboxypeptidase-like regulatory domain-containing protein, partial [Bacteroidales bacterium]|nr:carboxypeptidase-like regulatory domain-containing protein [Bacteroidales bacterium]